MKLGVDIKINAEEVEVQRTTRETKVTVTVNTIKDKQLKVETTVPFLNHMIETLAWQANLNIGVRFDSKIGLGHPVAEDIGITLGRAILELYKSKLSKGVEGFGFARGVLDKAVADAVISIEGRTYSVIDGPIFENVDGMIGYNLIAFLDGFCQGCKCTLRVEYHGKDPHHCWEAVFRALGLAIRKTFESNIWRKGTIAGMKGTLE